MVTAEIAMALPALALVLGFALTMQAAVADRAACLDAARAGAREAARGEDDAVVAAAVERVAPRVRRVEVERAAGLVEVRVTARRVVLDGRFALPSTVVSATTADEDGG